MIKSSSKKSLLDAYIFDGFKTSTSAKGKFGDKNARVLSLSRRSKKVSAGSAASFTEAIMIGQLRLFVIFPVAIVGFILSSKFGEFVVKRPV